MHRNGMEGFVPYASTPKHPLQLPAGKQCNRYCGGSRFRAVSLSKREERVYHYAVRNNHNRVLQTGETVIVLWLRLGDLRTHDNPALNAAATLSGIESYRVLPLLTLRSGLKLRGLNDSVVDLGKSLERRGSGLVVRFVKNEQHAQSVLNQIIKRVGALKVFVNRRGSHFIDYRSNGIGVSLQYFDLTNWNQTPLPSPLLLPGLPKFSPPCNFFSLSSKTHLEYGETIALNRLQTILAARDGPIFGILKLFNLTTLVASLMHLELRLGCITLARIRHEIAFKYSHPKEFALASLGSGAAAVAAISAYDVRGTDRRALVWDEKKKKFRLQEWEHKKTNRMLNFKQRVQEFFRRRKLNLHHIFIPDDVTPDYYAFTFWRFSQRCVSATVGVFGTRALLLALGVKAGRIGQAAAISWVLKDGLGRVGKMLWAGSMGKDFDIDPKRWRFRSALLYSCGNGLEIVTQIFPASFLVLATLANSMKQVSMLTASATRNAMYRSFGERAQNIANITAKGEAQIVVADLIGMASGIRLTKLIGTSRSSVLTTYLGLTAVDLFGIYMELRAVVFRTLNPERTNFIVQEYIHNDRIPEPDEINSKERIFLRPKMIQQNRFSSLHKAAKSPEQLERLMNIFRHERFMISCGSGPPGSRKCRIVLRKDASNEDVLRAIFITGRFQEAEICCGSENCRKTLYHSANKAFPRFYEKLRASKWNTDNLLYTTVRRRAAWGHAAHRRHR